MNMRNAILCIALVALVALPGCKGRGSQAPANATVAVTSGDLDLPGTAALVRDGRVQNTEELQRALNGPTAHRIDIDRDGQRDRLQVVERRDGKRRILDIRAVPSSLRGRRAVQAATPIASFEFDPEGIEARVTARYADIVVDRPTPITFVTPLVVGTFAYWLILVDHPVVVEVEHVHYKHKKHHKWH